MAIYQGSARSCPALKTLENVASAEIFLSDAVAEAMISVTQLMNIEVQTGGYKNFITYIFCSEELLYEFLVI